MRRGSALLIVLGMLAFMVVSAVAFSAYMRYSRLPSSYLRRSSSSRLLVKAALAEAIDEIDVAIGNNPYPGVGTLSSTYDPDGKSRYASGGATTQNRNAWMHRVYLGTNYVNNLCQPEETVSTLSLEALAYIPPALVNEARYYSRRSNAGRWRNLAFDAGRFAFCAIDVSDHFDVNRLFANIPRTAEPGGRISLAYLFESEEHTSSSGNSGSPASWDAFMDKFLAAGKVPLVSLADWNLAINTERPGGWTSPFCEYVTQNRSSFYGGISENGAEGEKIKRMTFVTDSLFPRSPEEDDANADYDLMDERNQPFEESAMSGGTPNLMNLLANGGRARFAERIKSSVCSLGFAALLDYLDQDKVPVSLALPTVERVPMVCGIQPEAAGGVTVTVAPNGNPTTVTVPQSSSPADTPALVTDPLSRVKTVTTQYTLDMSQLRQVMVSALLAYPFRHKDGVSDSFNVEGRIAFYFTSTAMGLRTKNQVDVLHVSGNPDFQLPVVGTGVYSIPLRFQNLNSSAFDNKTQEADFLKQLTAQLSQLPQTTIPFMTVSYSLAQTRITNPATDPPTYEYQPAFAAGAANLQIVNSASAQTVCQFPPLTSNGKVDPNYTTPAQLISTLTAGSAKLKLNAAIWVRVTHNDRFRGNKTVDLVPACLSDDALNGQNIGAAATFQSMLGEAYPVMRFDTGLELDLSPLAPATMGSPAMNPNTGILTLSPSAVMVADPRYNFAPESWFSVSDIKPDTWLSNCHRQDNDRDGDIFMMVSDQGYLQSIYELANLPRLTAASGGSTLQGLFGRPSTGFTGAGNGLSFAANFGDAANNGLMWRTYCPFPKYNADGDRFLFEDTGFVTDGGGFKINPYAESTNVVLAAFANTPHDWRCSSTNNYEKEFESMTAEQFNREYAWNAYSQGAKIDWEDLEYVAQAFIEDMRAGGTAKDWEEVWRKLGWDRNNADASRFILDQQLQNAGTASASGSGGTDYNLWNCEKKFLYGYWHDCFANRQQLFLVFVRAEPSMMGGGAAGQTPPQLGGRAVALVWRDPTPTADDKFPHQTRILFYRQFD